MAEHYKQGEIEAIEFIEQTVRHYDPADAYLVGNIIKYLNRAPHKGSMMSDLEKAEDYMHRLIHGVWKGEVKNE